MLLSTFLHLPGIGHIKEESLWRNGICTWDDYEKNLNLQLGLFKGEYNLLEKSRIALEKKDADFFAHHLPSKEYYRIIQTFPKETLFVDIETTGLSRYYDKITIVGWSINNQYDTYISGDNTKKMYEAFKNAKAIVTFNGSFFDIPFLKKEFSDLPIPACHIDLRFFSFRYKFKGGQKKIEKILNFIRPEDVREIGSEAAPVLWHRYKWKDIDSLKRLIVYNQYDIYGMKFIIDYLVTENLLHTSIPFQEKNIYKFYQKPKKLNFSFKHEEDKIKLIRFKGEIGPKIKFKNLPDFKNLKIVGIDLSGGEKRGTGWCFLKDKKVDTELLFLTQDIIEKTINCKPDIISIDSPLSLPEGRINVYDSDPTRNQYGIMRLCERDLKKRGVNVYPCLIRSMQKLTERGMILADTFRKMGYPVIESFPGAAQDILDIPRKRASIEYLIKGLEEFGVKGKYVKEKVSHDELDAITSALVGYFFWAGQFEALGNIQEDYLIIPSLIDEKNEWFKEKVVGISGPISAGKTTSAQYIETKGYSYSRYSLILNKLLEDEKEKINRENLQEIGNEINKEKGQRWLGQEVMKMHKSDKKLVIDGLRFPEDHAFWKEHYGPNFFHIFIKTDEILRKNRYYKDKKNNIPFEEAISKPVERKVTELQYLADHKIENNETKAKLYNKIEKILK